MITESSNYSIRRALASDVRAITECVRSAYAKYVSRIGTTPAPVLENYDHVVRQHEVWVLQLGQACGGVIVLAEQPNCLLIENVAVHPEYQHHGFGRALLRFAEAEARQKGLGALRLYTHEKMFENISLYTRLGFREVERRLDQGYQRVFMCKTLRGRRKRAASAAEASRFRCRAI